MDPVAFMLWWFALALPTAVAAGRFIEAGMGR